VLASPDSAGRPACPSESALADFVAGAASDGERAAIERHIDACDRCGATLRDYARAFASNDDGDDQRDFEPRPITAAPFAGRYRIECCVGFGAGGTVYRAHDPELDRIVALKVLRTGPGGSTQPDSRWTREAKVMARVVHPNVVAVHDVGIDEDQLFIAAEFVEGSNLDEWLEESVRGWSEVLEVFVEAGRGLAAIHDSGLAHRDFKPHNVMVGRDRRVRVTDFGLARLLPELDATESDLTQDSSSSLTLLGETIVSRTRPGTLVGTPAYMAPEQLRGEPADARSDQFGFCVALYEALWGVRPFSGKTVIELAERVCNDSPRTPPKRPRVPRWLVQVVMRGLSREPEARFADMQALLHALTDAPRRRRQRRITLALALGFALVAGGGYAAAGLSGAHCDVDPQRLHGVWDDEVRFAVETALTDTPEIAHAVTQELDAWVESWHETSREACETALVLERSSSRQLELQRACLDRRLSELRAASEILGTIDESGRTLDVLATLGSPRKCADLENLEAVEPQWGSPLAQVLSREIAGDLDRVEALRASGRIDEARDLARSILTRVDDSEYQAVRAEALLELGQVLSAAKDADAAEKALRDAVWAAEASGHVEVAARGWIELVVVLGNVREDYEQGQQAAQRAAAAIHRLRDPVAALDLAANQAVTASLHGLYEEALEQNTDVLERAREVFGEDHPQVARIHFNMAATLSHLGKLDEAIEHAHEGLAMFEARFSGRHPLIVEMLNTLGALELQRGNTEAGQEHLERALALAREVLRDDHPTMATLLVNLAQIDMIGKRHDDAAQRYRQALEIYRAAHGTAHPDIALAMHNLASALDGAGDREEAIAIYRETLDMRLQTNGPEHPGTANTLHNLGLVLVSTGEIDEGIEHMERALELRERAKVDPYRRATTNFMLARAYEKRGELERAIEHAGNARDYLRGIAPRHADILEHIEGWLAQRER
jgi:eukaryotic-like serine/threonine-protein kinase